MSWQQGPLVLLHWALHVALPCSEDWHKENLWAHLYCIFVDLDWLRTKQSPELCEIVLAWKERWLKRWAHFWPPNSAGNALGTHRKRAQSLLSIEAWHWFGWSCWHILNCLSYLIQPLPAKRAAAILMTCICLSNSWALPRGAPINTEENTIKASVYPITLIICGFFFTSFKSSCPELSRPRA